MISRKKYLEVTFPGGQIEWFALGSRAILGAGDGAAISLPTSSGLADEHVLFVPSGKQGCWVGVAANVSVPLVRDGEVVSEGLVPWGASLALGALRLRVLDHRPVERVAEVNVATVRRRLLAVSGALAFVGAVWLLSRAPAPERVSAPAGQAPALFAQGGACPRDVEPATHAAFAWRAAESRSERYPFAAGDGISAVALYEEAAACFEKSGDTARAREVRDQAVPLRKQVESDYVSLRLDLQLALADGENASALVAVRRLMPLVAHLDDTGYPQKLQRVERLLSLKGESK